MFLKEIQKNYFEYGGEPHSNVRAGMPNGGTDAEEQIEHLYSQLSLLLKWIKLLNSVITS